MDFNYSENQKIISETIKDFSKREIVPYMNEWDEKQIFPIELFKKNWKFRNDGCFSSRGIRWFWFIL